MVAAPGAAQVEIAPIADTTPPDTGREETYETARGIGMGAGSRSSATGTSAMAYNAANLPLAPLYHIETSVGYVPTHNYWTYGGAIADSISNKISAGMSFYGIHGGGDRNYNGFDGRLSLGYALGQSFALGVSGRYARLNSRAQTEDGEPVGADVRAFSIDASLRLTAFEGLNIAALGYNLIRSKTPLAPLQVGGSASYSFGGVFTVGGDLLVDLTTFESAELILGGGLEYLAADSVPIRVGYRRDNGRDIHQFTASVGYVDRSFGIDFGLRRDIASDTNDTQMVLNFRYHVQ